MSGLRPSGAATTPPADSAPPQRSATAPDALRLEFRVQGGAQWLPLPVRANEAQLYWNAETTGIVDVRLRARDRAGNWGEATTQVSLNGTAGVTPPGVQPNRAVLPGVDPDRKFVNSKRISLNYEIKDKGPSGVSAVTTTPSAPCVTLVTVVENLTLA